MGTLELLRQARIGPFTVFDTGTAYIGVFLLAPLLSKLFSIFKLYISRTHWLWLTLPIAVMFHLILHIKTPFIKMLFAFPSVIFSLLILLFMLYMGLKDIKNPKTVNL